MARILVVDDQEEVAELVQAMLTDAGHAVEAVYSGQAALDRLKRTVYDLVVCDVCGCRTWMGGPSSTPSGN